MIEELKEMYEKYPFPYRDISKEDNKQFERRATWIPFCLPHLKDYKSFKSTDKILDAGCGTGDFTLILGLSGAKVTGIDGTSKSIEVANQFKSNLKIKNVNFINSTIEDFKPKEKFDYIFCIGVLHHNLNPYELYLSLTKYLKSGGYIVLGLHNKYHCTSYHLKHLLLKLRFGNNTNKKIEYIKNKKGKESYSSQELASIADHYANPHGSSHSIGEILKWFKNTDINYMGSFLPLELSYYPTLFKYLIIEDTILFKKTKFLTMFDNFRFIQFILELIWFHDEGKNFRIAGKMR